MRDRPLFSGLTEDTRATSLAAALSADKATTLVAVFKAIHDAGAEGRTDDELQVQLNMRNNSQAPRRYDLWKIGKVQIRRDANGKAVRRPTRTGRNANVWVAA